MNDKVTNVIKTENSFSITTQNNMVCSAKRLLFATGITDIMPTIDNFEDCWGITAVHCPYCHGYEARDKKTGILGNGEAAYHYAGLLQQLTNDITIYTNGKADFTEEQLEKFAKHKIAVIEDSLIKLKQSKGQAEALISRDGKAYLLEAVYHRAAFVQHTLLPQDLGCELDDHGYIKTDPMQKTNIPGIYACGDCTTPMRSVATAVATGNKAGAVINSDLAFEVF